MRWGLRRLEFGDKSDWPRLLTDVASRELLDDGLRDSCPGLWNLFRNLVVVEQDPPHYGREGWECPSPPQQPGGLQLVMASSSGIPMSRGTRPVPPGGRSP